MIISIFTPHGGCPEHCRFCDQNTSGGTPVSARHVTDTIEAHLKTGGRASELAFYGGTFTGLSRERQLAYLAAAKPYLAENRIGGVRIATRPDLIDDDWLSHLRDEYGLRTVELGVQSFDDNVLERLGRSHGGKAQVATAVAALKRLGLDVSLHLMIGCPGESRDCDDELAREVTELSPNMVRLHPLLVLEGTTLEEDLRAGKFSPLPLEDAVERLATLTETFERAGIRVIRIGLQPNELLNARVVAGPYHPGLGDLVRARVLRRKVALSIAATQGAGPGAKIELKLGQRAASQLPGQSSCNLEWLRAHFDLSAIELAVLKEDPLYDNFKIRVLDPAWPSERRQVEPAQ